MTPNLREAHAHLGPLGEALSLPSLHACTSLAEVLNQLSRDAAATSPDHWLLVKGARIESWPEHRWPTLAEIDRATGSVPTVVMSFDHHQALANSAALAAANLSAGQRINTNGRVDADAHGRHTGLLHEDAAYACWNAAPEPTLAQRTAHVAHAINHLIALGYNEVHDLHSQPWLPDALHHLAARDELNITVWMYPPFDRIELEAARHRPHPRIHLAGGKLFADGTINSRTALMLDPYADPLSDAPCGRAMHTPREIESAIARCDALGLHIAVHAIGDGTVRMVLDAFETVKPRTPGSRIEHAELIHPSDIPRFANLGITCSVQPCHLLADIEALRRLLPHALDRVLPLRSLINSGLTPGAMTRGLVFGSDVPIVPADPNDSIQAAVHRRRADTPLNAAINPDEAIDQETAWSCFRNPFSA